MSSIQKKNHLSLSSLRKSSIIFGLSLGTLSIVLSALRGHTPSYLLIGISICIPIVGFIRPSLLIKPYEKWLSFGFILESINSYLILSVFFYLLIFPFSIIKRSFRIFRILFFSHRTSGSSKTSFVRYDGPVYAPDQNTY